MKKISPYHWLAVLLAACFTLATLFVPRAGWWNNAPDAAHWRGDSGSENAFKMLLGEGRKLFANECFTMADVYFHSGFYPSIFDQQERTFKTPHMAEMEGWTTRIRTRIIAENPKIGLIAWAAILFPIVIPT